MRGEEEGYGGYSAASGILPDAAGFLLQSRGSQFIPGGGRAEARTARAIGQWVDIHSTVLRSTSTDEVNLALATNGCLSSVGGEKKEAGRGSGG